MKYIKHIIAAVLAVSLLALSGCGGNPTWVYSAEGIEVQAGVYVNMIMTSISELEKAEKEAHEENVYDQYTMPPLREFLKQVGQNGLTYSQTVVSRATELAREYLAVELLFKEKGLKLSDEERRAIDDYCSGIYTQNKDMYERNGIAESSVKSYQTNLIKKDILFDLICGEGGEIGISEAELVSYFESNYVRLELMQMYISDWEGEVDPAEKERAEKYFERYQKGESIVVLVNEYELSIEDEGYQAKEYKPGDLDMLADFTEPDDDALMTAIRNAPLGTPQMFERNNMVYFFRTLELADDPTLYENLRSQTRIKLKGEEYISYLEDYANSLDVRVNEDATSRYTPENIK